ncbi:MAG: Transposase, partial [uncultured Nocardioidaceae bacterium]
AGDHPRRRRPGPRRRRAADGGAVRAVPVPAEALRRQRLPRRAIPGRAASRLRPGQPGNRQALRPPQVRRAAEALDRREDHRLAQPLSPPGQGLGVPEPQRARIPALGLRPPHAAKAMPENNM